jgi:FkbM family methyltransferase
MLIDFRKLFPKYGIKPSGVLHLGANVGEEAPVYDELGIKDVIWVEANPDLIPQLVTNTNQYKHGIILACMGDVEGKEVDFHVSNNAGQSSSILELGTHKIAHPEVHYVESYKTTMRRGDVLFNEIGLGSIDFLNLDLQGAELLALRGMGDLLKQFKWIYTEVNQQELYKGCVLVGDLDLFLNGHGFKRVETSWCGNTGWGDALYIKGI